METNEQKHIYISGPITGVKDWNQTAFYKADKYYRNCGYFVLNPHRIVKGMDNPSETEILKEELTLLLQHADVIALLPDWETSKGALIEVAAGLAAGIPFIDAFSHRPITPRLSIHEHGSNTSKKMAFDPNKRSLTPHSKRREQEEQYAVCQHMQQAQTAP